MDISRSISGPEIEAGVTVTYTCKMDESFPLSTMTFTVNGAVLETKTGTDNLVKTFQVKTVLHHQEVKCSAQNQFGTAEASDSFEVFGTF